MLTEDTMRKLHEVYDGFGCQSEIHGIKDPCRGLMINGGEFGAALCRHMGISRLVETMATIPTFVKEQNILVLDLIEAKREKVNIDLNYFALPAWQFEEEMRILEEEDVEIEEDEEE